MEVIILIGLQASGKSTFHRQHFAATHAYVSRDQFRNSRDPKRRQRELIAQALASGQSVVVDNTSPRAADRAPVIQQAREQGAEVVGYFFEPDIRASVARNRSRQGMERVPDVAIFSTAKRLERPSLAEGFDRLFRVRASGDSRFEVVPLETVSQSPDPGTAEDGPTLERTHSR